MLGQAVHGRSLGDIRLGVRHIHSYPRQHVSLSQRNVWLFLRSFGNYRFLKFNLFHHSDLPLLNLRVDFENHASLDILSVINHLVFFDCFIIGMGRTNFFSCKFVVYFDTFSSLFQDIVNIQSHYHFLLWEPVCEELGMAKVNSVAEHVAEDQAQILEKLGIR